MTESRDSRRPLADGSAAPALDSEAEWSRLRRPYWQERVALWGEPEDFAGLVRTLLQENSRGVPGALAAADDALRHGCERHPRAVPLWELVLLVSAMTGRRDAMNGALATIERLDPQARALGVVDQISGASTQEYRAAVAETHDRLLQQLRSPDVSVRESAVTSLAQWARTYPTNSTYVINYGLGLMATDRLAEAHQVAAEAQKIEDGSFADAYNIGLILLRAGRRPEAAAMLGQAVRRAGGAEERRLAEGLLAESTR